MAEQPDIIEQGHGRLSLPRRAAIAIVAGTAATVLIASSVVAMVRPWAGGGLPDPCEILPAATVADLLAAAAGGAPAVFTGSTTTTEMCTWRATSGTLLSLDVEFASSKDLAQREFSALPDAVGPAFAAAVKPLPCIGDQAQAVLDTGFPDEVAVYVRVLSGSTLFGIGYNSPRTGLRPQPGDQAILAKLVPAARTALSSLAKTPSATAGGCS